MWGGDREKTSAGKGVKKPGNNSRFFHAFLLRFADSAFPEGSAAYSAAGVSSDCVYTTEGSVKSLPSAKRLSRSREASMLGSRPRIISAMTVPVTGPNMKPCPLKPTAT